MLAAAVAVLAGCGDPVAPTNSGRSGELLVSAAASLKGAFTAYGEVFTDADVKFSFAGSDELAAQIRSGARPDVFASANTALARQLHDAGLVERPQTIASNRLVVAVPNDATKVRTFDDLAKPGVTIATGARSVPIGAYTQTVLERLDAGARRRIEANVRSREPDVGGITAKLTQGAVDAGIVYVTDVVATNGRLRAIGVPRELEPDVEYAVAIVKDTEHEESARAFVAGLRRGDGADALRAAGFRSPGR